MKTQHTYNLTLEWTGNTGSGTSAYRAYSRNYQLSAENKPVIIGSSDPAFLGDSTRYNPEELLIASLSSCHMLWYLHLCAETGIVVTNYTDKATGTMAETANSSGHFTEVTLNPVVTVTDSAMVSQANQLHQKANDLCFIANSVNFPVKHKAVCLAEKA